MSLYEIQNKIFFTYIARGCPKSKVSGPTTLKETARCGNRHLREPPPYNLINLPSSDSLAFLTTWYEEYPLTS